MKKLLAAVLAFAMVMTGMYFVAPEASEAKAAENVPVEMLDIKLQQVGGANKTMRLITSVDSLDYKEVGFIVNNGTATTTMRTWTVFEKIKSTVGTEYNFSPKLVSASSEYFATAMFDVAYPDATYTVQAYVITEDGETVYGREIRSFSYNDGSASTTVNLLVQGTLAEGVTATYGPNATATDFTADSVTILGTNAGYTSVRVDLAGAATVDGLKSATKFVFSTGETAIYRNYYTTHVPTSGTTPVADTSWYDVNPSASEFFIATGADLYGFAAIQNDPGATNWDTNTHFKLPKVTLVGDITLNKGTATANGWVADPGEAVYQFTEIGQEYYHRFGGIFDGDGNTIEGLVIIDSSSNTGLFGRTYTDSTLKNFQVKNSYIEGTHYVGVVGIFYGGTVENVYSDAYIKATQTSSSYGMAGGIIGELGVASKDYNIKNCWFNGSVEGQSYIGGLIGRCNVTGTKVYIVNCLNTGSVTARNSWAGGLYGFTNQWGNTYITNSICAGTVSSPNASATLGSFVGQTNSSKAYFIFNPGCYSTIPSTTMEIISKAGSYSSAMSNGTTANIANLLVAPTGYYTTAANLAETELSTLFPTYEGVSSSADWAKVTINGTLTPVPACFANWYNAQ